MPPRGAGGRVRGCGTPPPLASDRLRFPGGDGRTASRLTNGNVEWAHYLIRQHGHWLRAPDGREPRSRWDQREGPWQRRKRREREGGEEARDENAAVFAWL